MDFKDRAHIFKASVKKERRQLQSLLDLCIMKIVYDHATTRNALALVPRDLFHSFLVTAVIHERDLCVKEIVAQWPYRVLNMKTLIPQFNDKRKVRPRKRHQNSTYVNHFGNLFGMIMKGLQEQVVRKGKLQVVDITGLDLMVQDISMHASTTVTNLESLQTGPHLHTLVQSTDPPRTLYMDWIAEQHTCDHFPWYLNSVSCFVTVKCRLLRCVDMSRRQIFKMLKWVDPQMLESLNMSKCSLSRKGILRILPFIKRMANLTSLDLSYNFLGEVLRGEDQNINDSLGDVLGQLEHLTRLHLCGNRLSGKLRSVIQHMRKPLLGLHVSSCQLEGADIAYLANSHHATQLEELQLGYNNLSRDPESLFKLLTSSSTTLLYLGLEKASLGHIPLVANQLVHLSHNLKQLLTLTIKGNDLNANDIADIVSSYALNVPTLLICHIPLCSEGIRQPGCCVKVNPSLLEWDRDSVNFSGSIDTSMYGARDLITFLEICVRKFCQSEPRDGGQELHVPLTKLTTADDFYRPWPSPPPKDHCIQFQL